MALQEDVQNSMTAWAMANGMKASANHSPTERWTLDALRYVIQLSQAVAGSASVRPIASRNNPNVGIPQKFSGIRNVVTTIRALPVRRRSWEYRP